MKDHVRIARANGRETFVPVAHPPGHAQVDFGETVATIGGVRRKIHFFCMDLPHSDACFVKAYPRETTEAFLDGHVAAVGFFDGVPLSILYDNTRIAVAKICGGGRRDRTRAFTGALLDRLTHHVSILSLNGDSYRLRSSRRRRDRTDARAEQNQAIFDPHDPETGEIRPG